MVWSGARPHLSAVPVPRSGLVLGRDTLADTGDDRLSRQHARIGWNGTCFAVADLGSRNGTFVGGSLVADGDVTALPPVVVRTGRTISVLCSDVARYAGATVSTDGAVVGPTLRPSWDAIARAARAGLTLLVAGELGTGHAVAARTFHAASGARGALVAIDCQAGAAALTDDHLAAVGGGTLYLDELALLDAAAQARLVRALDAGVRVVAATRKELRAEVQAGRVRDDLHERIARVEVRLPALRDRVEDIPWLVAEAVRASRLPAHPSLVEACLLRPWPGNVRELIGEVGRAAAAAVAAARKAVRAEELDGSAGQLLASGESATLAPVPSSRPRSPTVPEHDAILDALRAEGGNVSRAARRLGLSRSQLRRYLVKYPDAAELAGADALTDDEPSLS